MCEELLEIFVIPSLGLLTAIDPLDNGVDVCCYPELNEEKGAGQKIHFL